MIEDCNESNPDDDDGNLSSEGDVQFTRNPNLKRDRIHHNTHERDSPPPSYPCVEKDEYQRLPPSPDRTVAETVVSSNWSLEDGVTERHGRGGEHAATHEHGECNALNKTMAPLTLWNAQCFFNPYDILGICLQCFGFGERQKRRVPSGVDGLSSSFHSNDCFVRVDCSTTDTATTRLLESDYSWNDSYYYPYNSDRIMILDDDEQEQQKEVTDEVDPMPRREQTQQPTQHPPSTIKNLGGLKSRMTYPPPQIRQVNNIDQKLTPISEHTKSSKYDAFSSLNTLHRRNDHYSVSFFTSETLDAIIHTSPPSGVDSITPRDHESGVVSARQNPSEYRTPPNRARADSDTFRRTIQVVTCEKRVRDEVSPIPMDTPRFDNTTPRRQYEHQSAGEQTASNQNVRSVNLFEEEFMVDAMNEHHQIPPIRQCPSTETEDEETAEYGDCNDSVLMWPAAYLQKSPSYIKALRRAGRKGKCLIQGWVAFRQSEPWNDIIRNPRRCDFRYVVLLDDMPLLHLFSSRPKTKKTEPKKNVFEDGITFDLSNEIGVEVQLASQELGNEICIVDTDTGAFYCSLLPISMPDDVFQDKHRSRLAKSDVLSNVFAPSIPQEIIPSLPIDELEKTIIDPLEYSQQLYAPAQQYDVSRHLMFVLDAAIQFPLPRIS